MLFFWIYTVFIQKKEEKNVYTKHIKQQNYF